MTRSKPIVIGHRGAPGYRPEHTRSCYELAFAQGVDAVEPDVVFTADGIPVVRHENEIGATTDVGSRPEYAGRRTTKTVDGEELTGWFTEDFTWAELSGLRCRERLPQLRPGSATFDDQEPPLRLAELLDLAGEASASGGREIGVVLEVKHATYFTGLGIDVAGAVAAELRAAGWAGGEHPLYLESFEEAVLGQVRAHGIQATFVYLIDVAGSAHDLTASGADAPTYREQVSLEGLDGLAGRVDGISLDKATILQDAGLVAAAHARGLQVFTWTARPENAFLSEAFRRGQDPAAFGDYQAEWRRLVDAGVDGVFVDHPDLWVALPATT